MKKFKKVLSIVLIVLLLLYISGSIVATQVIFTVMFPRVEEVTCSALPLYDEVAQDYPREEITFPSGKNQLTGWLYGPEDSDALVVMAHGLGTTAQGNLPITMWFADQGYRVLTYDATGSGASQGKNTRGMSQSVLDLDSALTWAESQEELADLPVLLFGHSWGAYGVTRILAYDHDITASVAVAGYDTPMELMTETATNFCGPVAYMGYPFLWLQQVILFGSAANGSAARAVNESDTPVFLIHGTEDTTVLPEGSGLISEDFTGDNVTTLLLEGEDHVSVLKPQTEVYEEYTAILQAQFEELRGQFPEGLPQDVEEEFYGSIDKSVTGGVNEELMEQIQDFYQEALGNS